MLYSFTKYITPGWYFNLFPNKAVPYFLDYDLLDDQIKVLISIDAGYSSWQISKQDAAYQAFQKGCISQQGLSPEDLLSEPSIKDCYRFIKKYFNEVWVYYIFLIRIFSLNNPIKEFTGLFNSLKVKRLDIYRTTANQTAYDDYRSSLVESQPLVSVIIPTLNRYSYLKDVLSDLEAQTYSNFEVIIIDQTDPYDEGFYKKWQLNLTVEFQEEKAVWLARNKAIKMSKGKYILLYDDDSRVDEHWIFNHLKCLDFYMADISSGVSLSVIGAKIPKHYSFFRWSDQIDTGNVMIKKKVFAAIGLFDRQFEKQRQGDGEFGLRAYLFGFQNISNPKSSRIHLKADKGGLRQMGSWDGFRPKKWLAPRPIPSVLYLLRKYFGNKEAFYSLVTGVPPSLLPYRFKKNRLVFFVGIIITSCAAPLVIWAVLRSWFLASKMLKTGAKIEFVDFSE